MKKVKIQRVPEYDEHFNRFWAAFPWHIAKLDARKAWSQLDPSPELVECMMIALAWQSALWARQGFGTPYAATWIRGQRWMDEPPAASPNGNRRKEQFRAMLAELKEEE